MDMKLVLGLLIGIILAVSDALLMRYIVHCASKNRTNVRGVVLGGFLLRYLLTGAVLACALLFTSINAVAVILVLIAQKVIMVLLAAFPLKK
ncbi:ATP synthase subunit I [Oscillospiraceae bacterium PP1C4]